MFILNANWILTVKESSHSLWTIIALLNRDYTKLILWSASLLYFFSVLSNIGIYFLKTESSLITHSQRTYRFFVEVKKKENFKKFKNYIIFWLIKPAKYDASSLYWLLNVSKGLLSGTTNPSVWAGDPLPIHLSPSHCNKYDVSPTPESQLSASELYWPPSPILSGHSALFTNIWVSVSPPVLACFSFPVPLLAFKKSFLLILRDFYLLVRAVVTLNIHLSFIL